jgi:hypothetical protein
MNKIRTGQQSIQGRAFKVMMLVGGLLALSCPRGWAAAKPPTVLTFSESWNDKGGCTSDNGCSPYTTGKFTVKAVISSNNFGAAIDPGQFSTNDTFDISLGGYSFSTNGWYVAGEKKATFVLTTEVCDASGDNCPEKKYETIALSWTTKAVTLSISATTESDANGNTFENAIDVDTFEPADNGPGSYTDTISFNMDLGSLNVFSSIVPVNAKVATSTDSDGDQLSHGTDSGTLPASDLGQ